MVQVPLNHSDPSSSTIDLGLLCLRAKHENATHGNLFINAGGPDIPTTNMVKLQDTYEQRENISFRQFS